MARTSEPNSQGSQFFIVLSDAAAGPLEQARTYAILGEVAGGMDTVDAISQVPLGGGTQPIDPVVIESVTVTRTTP
jgi:peptidyl-prolyl cis-trans isomerase B (cyclophilin B)